ncbi:hypothetical protein Fot_05725 [Forsythia ovata]|uniref:Uncharacterized protein n=1 Tax=Forsythia ovata TaxID=205694 RepID=A0ABD1WQZ0_9LAMI
MDESINVGFIAEATNSSTHRLLSSNVKHMLIESPGQSSSNKRPIEEHATVENNSKNMELQRQDLRSKTSDIFTKSLKVQHFQKPKHKLKVEASSFHLPGIENNVELKIVAENILFGPIIHLKSKDQGELFAYTLKVDIIVHNCNLIILSKDFT